MKFLKEKSDVNYLSELTDSTHLKVAEKGVRTQLSRVEHLLHKKM